MNVRGHATVDAPRAAVFAAICDPRTLLEIIPGCREINQVSDDEYRGRIALRLPAIVGTYDTVVRLVETDPPAYGAFDGRVDGRAGGITGHASFRLAETGGGTTIDYEGTGVVGGPLARLDSRFVESLAKGLIDEGIARLGRRLQVASPESAPTESAPTGSASVQSASVASASVEFAPTGSAPAQSAPVESGPTESAPQAPAG